eukprot:scpid49789/ scgid25883/ Disintegrin and metalloproteinase domain-containing protein 28; Thymic epithelial cell-ADAM
MAASSQQNSSLEFARVLGIITLILMLSRCCAHVDAESRGSNHADIAVEARERISKMTDEYEVVHIDMTQHLSDVEHASNRGKRDATAQGQHDDQSSSEHVHVHHPPTSSFQIRAFGKTVTLDLKQNTELIPASFKVFTFNSIDESPVITRGAVNCYYHGTVRGLQNVSHAQSTLHKHRKRQQSSTDASEESSAAVISTYAAVSTCNGLSGSFGFEQYAGHGEEDPARASSSNSSSNEQGKAYSERYMIEPLVSQTSKPGTYPHAVFKESTYKMSKEDPLKGGCATHWNISATKNTSRGTAGEKQRWDFPDDGLAGLASAARKRVKRSSSTGGGRDPTLYVELAVLSDYSFTKARGYLDRGTGKLVEEILLLVSVADYVFQRLNIRIVLSAVFIYQAPGAPFFLPDDHTDDDMWNALRHFNQYTLKHLAHYNAVHLFTSTGWKKSEGYASISSVCPNTPWSLGIDSNRETSWRIRPYVFIHEIGHNIGFKHVAHSCKCNAEVCPFGHIMAPNGGGNWSDCTKARLEWLHAQGWRLRCLLNKPEPALSTPVCGNGVVERGEECDCGQQKFCKDYCCVARTCRFKISYRLGKLQCSSAHACCARNCTLLKAGTLCRPAKDFCDLPDFCDGTNADCPKDDLKQAGVPCIAAEEPGACYDGSCRNVEKSCKTIVKRNTSRSDHCNVFNRHGEEHGHCHYDDSTGTRKYFPCKPKDIGCGVLWCAAPYPQNTSCYRAIRYDLRPLPLYDQFYVDDASPCGPGLVCWNGSCVNASALWQCPKTNGAGCSGHGTCTFDNVCRCAVGWHGNNCQYSGKQVAIPSTVAMPTSPEDK